MEKWLIACTQVCYSFYTPLVVRNLLYACAGAKVLYEAYKHLRHKDHLLWQSLTNSRNVYNEVPSLWYVLIEIAKWNYLKWSGILDCCIYWYLLWAYFAEYFMLLAGNREMLHVATWEQQRELLIVNDNILANSISRYSRATKSSQNVGPLYCQCIHLSHSYKNSHKSSSQECMPELVEAACAYAKHALMF